MSEKFALPSHRSRDMAHAEWMQTHCHLSMM